jgi:hypothetical protein
LDREGQVARQDHGAAGQHGDGPQPGEAQPPPGYCRAAATAEAGRAVDGGRAVDAGPSAPPGATDGVPWDTTGVASVSGGCSAGALSGSVRGALGREDGSGEGSTAEFARPRRAVSTSALPAHEARRERTDHGGGHCCSRKNSMLCLIASGTEVK